MIIKRLDSLTRAQQKKEQLQKWHLKFVFYQRVDNETVVIFGKVARRALYDEYYRNSLEVKSWEYKIPVEVGLDLRENLRNGGRL